jgi:beta-xylosidase
MIEAVMLWNEPNNLSHWDFHLDPDWSRFAAMTICAAQAIRAENPSLRIVLGGISPIDPGFIQLMASYGVLDVMDVVSVHGFPLDWNHWNIHQWPQKLNEVRAVTGLPVWVSEAGVSSFGAEEVQSFGIQRTAELLRDVERVHWYSLFDLPATWTATTRHKEAEGSSYYRHYYMGLLKEDGSPKLAASQFPSTMGLCQWFHYQDHRLQDAVRWMREHQVRYLRTGISWADSFRENAELWFDAQMSALEPFDVTLTLCFTPEHLGLSPHYASPPKRVEDFADFARWAVRRYAPVQKDAQREGLLTNAGAV